MHASLKELQAVLTSAQLLTKTLDLHVNGLATDSRRIHQGNLFLALRGEQFDAHDFLESVASSGAAAVVAEHVPDGYKLPALIVPDTQVALAEIARHWRRQFSIPVIGVTGSNGKTTVKEMIAAILHAYAGADHYLSTTGNLNNEIGVPLTVLRLQSQHRCAVIELGMNHPGEIALLTSVALPTVGLVNNAQREHQEFMQSVDAVAEENGSVLRALPADGIAVFPADDTYTALWRSYAAESGQRRVLTFGLTANSDVRGSYQAHAFGSEIKINIGDKAFSVNLSAAGSHNVLNALAAAACCHSIGVPNDVIARGLEAFQPVNGRLQRKTAVNGASIIDDTYNANPDSVRAAIDVLAQIGGSALLVLGDMGEVGEDGIAFHEEIGTYARARGIKHMLTMGVLAQHATSAFGEAAKHFDTIENLLAALDASISSTSTVLVKGSRFMKMERVVAHLTQQKTLGNH
ncbi:UDP-N-acetylmuramoyl-tripeptide--D-alanyl-D-alanine ligase [Undibacterium sp.]|uniref:UDP-N-acetylmuramoyl-tripeptide--D-alanyl-D- alanine ligase n=1 Tax=Undibacterium sp. TaxID=1914977 RepID=UPI00260063D9|nr:UDP-N-acetylmuramoyl-tripeptide--D-alanyl-D-alanine ligase [Undibacterium sp.]